MGGVNLCGVNFSGREALAQLALHYRLQCLVPERLLLCFSLILTCGCSALVQGRTTTEPTPWLRTPCATAAPPWTRPLAAAQGPMARATCRTCPLPQLTAVLMRWLRSQKQVDPTRLSHPGEVVRSQTMLAYSRSWSHVSEGGPLHITQQLLPGPILKHLIVPACLQRHSARCKGRY